MSKLTVLIVDDEEAIRANVVAFLEDEGLQVKATESGEEAVALVKSGNNYSVCVMDMRLPGMDGNTAILALHELCPETQFVIHTGSANYSLPYSLRSIGISDEQVFMKPLEDMSPLAELVEQLMDEGGKE